MTDKKYRTPSGDQKPSREDKEAAARRIYDMTQERGWNNRTMKLNSNINPIQAMMMEVRGKQANLGNQFSVPITDMMDGIDMLEVKTAGMSPADIQTLQNDLQTIGIPSSTRTASDGTGRVFVYGDGMARFRKIFMPSSETPGADAQPTAGR